MTVTAEGSLTAAAGLLFRRPFRRSGDQLRSAGFPVGNGLDPGRRRRLAGAGGSQMRRGSRFVRRELEDKLVLLDEIEFLPNLVLDIFRVMLQAVDSAGQTVSYTHLRAHETDSYLVCRLLLEKK